MQKRHYHSHHLHQRNLWSQIKNIIMSWWSYHPQPTMLMRWLMKLINHLIIIEMSSRVRRYRSPGGQWRHRSADHTQLTWSVWATDGRTRDKMSHRWIVEDTPPPSGVSLTWSVSFVSGAGGPSAVVAGRWGRGDRGSPLLAHGRIHSWNTEAQIYKSTYKTLPLALNTSASRLSFFSKCVFVCFFSIFIQVFITVEGTDTYQSWQKLSFVSFCVCKYSDRRR